MLVVSVLKILVAGALFPLPSDTPPSRIDAFLTQHLDLQAAGAGVSGTQKAFRRPLWILAALATWLANWVTERVFGPEEFFEDA